MSNKGNAKNLLFCSTCVTDDLKELFVVRNLETSKSDTAFQESSCSPGFWRTRGYVVRNYGLGRLLAVVIMVRDVEAVIIYTYSRDIMEQLDCDVVDM